MSAGGSGPAIEFRVLGPFEVLHAGRALALGSPKQRALLAALVISANGVVSVDRLAEELWGDEPPARAMASLQAYVSRLRRLLQPEGDRRGRSDVVVTQPPGYLLRVAPESIDAVRFERQAVDGIRLMAGGDAGGALAALDRALTVWRGPPYADFSYETFAQAEIARLTELRLAAVEARLSALIATGQAATAIAEAEAVVREAPLREGVWGSLMTALYAAGRQGEAMRAYQRARQILGDELGLEPGPVLQELEAGIVGHTLQVGLPRLLAVPPAGRRPPERAAASDPLVGREEELARIGDAVRDSCGGDGRTVLVHGEPGIGKSRLAREAAAVAARQGAVVGYGGCVAGQVTAAYWPWTSALRGLVQRWSTEELPESVRTGLAELAQLDPMLGRWAGGVTTLPAPADPEVARARLQRAGVDTVVGLSELRPVALVLEDLQWADASSLHLLSLAAPELARARVVIVATYRAQEVSSALASALAAVRRAGCSVDIPLEGLDARSVRAVVELAAGEQVSEAVAATITARTAGNPLFVGELARLLRSERALDEEGVRHAPVPAGVREVIRRRLDRLPPQTATVLTVAAVIGRRFELAVLAGVAELPEDDLLDQVESAVAVGLVNEDGGPAGTFSFAHDLVRETLREAVSGTRRARLHARVARALVAHRAPGDAARPFEVAHHFVQALPLVPAEEVAAHVVAAADAAIERVDFEQAEEELRRALKLVDLLPAGERDAHELAVRVRLARVLTFLHGHASAEVMEHSARAGELAGGVDDRPEVVQALWAVAVASAVFGDGPKALAVSRRLLAWGEEHDDPNAQCLGHSALGAFSYWFGDVDTAAHHSERAVELVDAGVLDLRLLYDAELSTGVAARVNQAIALWLAGRERDADTALADSLRRAQEADDPSSLLFASCYDAFLATLRRDRARAHRRATEAVERADALVSHQFGLTGRILQAATAPEPSRARVLRELVRTWEASGARVFLTLFLGLQAEAELDLGGAVEAAATLDRALDIATVTGERFYEPELHRLRGDIARHGGRHDDALRNYERAGEVVDELGLGGYRDRVAASLEAVRPLAG